MDDVATTKRADDLVALGTASFSILALELLQIRVFSYSIPPFLVWCAISVALLGMGIGAVLVAVRPRIAAGEGRVRLAACLVAFSIATILVHAVFARIGTLGRIGTDIRNVPVMLMFGVPYFFGGLIIAIVLSRRGDSPYRPYLINLVGSALGCIAPYPLMRALGVESLIGLIAAVPAVAGLWIAYRERAMLAAVWAKVAVVLAIVCAFTGPAAFPFAPDEVDLYARSKRALEERHPDVARASPPRREFSAWDPVGRVEVFWFPDPFGRIDDRPVRLFAQDAGAGSILLSLGDDEKLKRALFETTCYGAAYAVHPEPQNVLIIGVGGGPDLLAALHHGAKKIQAVEINRAVLDAIGGEYAEFLGGPFPESRLKLIHMDGRSFIEQSTERFDVIQMTGVDTLAAASGGAFLFAENYLYTEEAFDRYLSRLSDGGVLHVIRFGAQPARVVTTAFQALRRRGVKNPEHHLIVLRQGVWVSVLVSLQPLEPPALQRTLTLIGTSQKREAPLRIPVYEVLTFGLHHPVVLIWAPWIPCEAKYVKFMEALGEGNMQGAWDAIDQGFDFTPITDDRPFFFNYMAMRHMKDLLDFEVKGLFYWRMRNYLAFLLGTVLASGLLVIGPLVVLRRRGLPAGRAWPAITCFGALGLGYLFVELALLQKTALLLGHPTYSTAATLFTLLAATGLGSLHAGRWRDRPVRTVRVAVAALVVLVILYLFFLGPVLRALLPLPFSVRLLALVVLIAPAGWLMGMPFPSALRTASADGGSAVAWALAINGFASVAASLIASPMAMMGGFSLVLQVAAALYILAALTLGLYVRRQQAAPATR